MGSNSSKEHEKEDIKVELLPPDPDLFTEFENVLKSHQMGHQMDLNFKVCEIYWAPFNKSKPMSMTYNNDEYTPGIVMECRWQLFRFYIFNYTKKIFYQLGDEKTDDELCVVGCGKYTYWGKLEGSDILKKLLNIFNSSHLKPKPKLKSDSDSISNFILNSNLT
jgi:hypothetical protein